VPIEQGTTQTLSGTYNFDPSVADLFLRAFFLLGIMPPEVTRSHVIQARRALNYVLSQYSNKGTLQWTIDLQTIALIAPTGGVGVGQYSPPANTVMMLDTYFTLINGGGAGINIDRIMTPMSRDDYAEIPNKLQPGTPTRYWFQRTIPPTIFIWNPWIGTPPAQISYWRMRRFQDATPQMGQQPDVEYRFINVLAWDLAIALAPGYKPELVAQPGNFLERSRDKAWDEAAGSNRDDTPITITPRMGGYWRP